MEEARRMVTRRETFEEEEERIKKMSAKERARRATAKWHWEFYRTVAKRALNITTTREAWREWLKTYRGPEPEGHYLFSVKEIRNCRRHEACITLLNHGHVRETQDSSKVLRPHAARWVKLLLPDPREEAREHAVYNDLNGTVNRVVSPFFPHSPIPLTSGRHQLQHQLQIQK